jgi:hypothetical protein
LGKKSVSSCQSPAVPFRESFLACAPRRVHPLRHFCNFIEKIFSDGNDVVLSARSELVGPKAFSLEWWVRLHETEARGVALPNPASRSLTASSCLRL